MVLRPAPIRWLLPAVLCAALVPVHGNAQTHEPPPCCSVVRVDSARSEIVARETATGYTFRVEVKSRRQLLALKVGDRVWANFAVRRVRLGAADDSLCCAILDTPAPAPPTAAPAKVRRPFTQPES